MSYYADVVAVPYRSFGTTYRSCIQETSSRIEDCFSLEDGTDRLSQNVGKELPLLAAQQPRRALFSGTVSDVRSFPATAVYSIDFAAGKFGFRKSKRGPSQDKKVHVVEIRSKCDGEKFMFIVI